MLQYSFLTYSKCQCITKVANVYLSFTLGPIHYEKLWFVISGVQLRQREGTLTPRYWFLLEVICAIQVSSPSHNLHVSVHVCHINDCSEIIDCGADVINHPFIVVEKMWICTFNCCYVPMVMQTRFCALTVDYIKSVCWSCTLQNPLRVCVPLNNSVVVISWFCGYTTHIVLKTIIFIQGYGGNKHSLMFCKIR